MTNWKIGAIAAGIITIGGVYTATQTLGFNLDRPAWKGEVMQLAGTVGENTQGILLLRLESDDWRLSQKKTLRDEYISKREPVPEWLEKDIRDLERRIEKTVKTIDSLDKP